MFILAFFFRPIDKTITYLVFILLFTFNYLIFIRKGKFDIYEEIYHELKMKYKLIYLFFSLPDSLFNSPWIFRIGKQEVN
jgi:presenilin-like A22 family membrane protease